MMKPSSARAMYCTCVLKVEVNSTTFWIVHWSNDPVYSAYKPRSKELCRTPYATTILVVGRWGYSYECPSSANHYATMFFEFIITFVVSVFMCRLNAYMVNVSMSMPGSNYVVQSPLARLEILMTHFAHASTLSTKAQFCTWFLTFASSMYKGEAARVIVGLIRQLSDMGDDDVDLQAGDVRDIAAECREFMVRYPTGAFHFADESELEVQSSWESFRTHFGFGIDTFGALRHAPLYRHGRKILAACLAGSLLSERMYADHRWFHKRLFEGVDAHNVDPVDLLDEVLSLTRVVLDAATRCVEERSLSPLLGRGRDAIELDLEFAFLAAHHNYYMNGLLERVTTDEGRLVTEEQFVCRVERFLLSLKRLHSTSRDAERAVLTSRLKQALTWDADIKESLGRAAMRIEPYAVLLIGPTAQGKTVTGMAIMRHTLQCNGYPHTRKYVAQIDTDSSFMDAINNTTQGVFIDDMANTRPQFSNNNEIMHLIRLKNSSVVPVPKAALEEKGRTYHQSKVLLVSTNKEDLGAKETQVEHSATLRRFDIALRVTTLPEYARQFNDTTVEGLEGRLSLNMIDPSRLTEGIYTPHQRFDVITWVPYDRPPSRPQDCGDWHVVKENGVPLRGLRYDELMRHISAHSASHFTAQRAKLEASRLDELAPICPHGGVTAGFCSLCRADAAAAVMEVQAGDWLTSALFPPPEPHAPYSPSSSDEEFMLPGGTFPTEDVSDISFSSAEPSPVHEESTRLSRFYRRMSFWRQERNPPPPVPGGHGSENSLKRWLSRVGSWWTTATVAPKVPDQPAPIGWLKAWSQGRFDLEEMALTHYDYVMLALLAIPPAAATACSSVLGLVGFGVMATGGAWFGAFAFTGVTLSRNLRGWIAARVAGATLVDLRKRATKMAQASFGVLATIVGVLALVKGVINMCKSESGPTAAAVASAGAAAEPVVAEVPSGSEMDLQGGVASTTGAVPDPIARVNTWERREVDVWYRVEGEVRNMTEDQIYAKAEKQVYLMVIKYASGNVVTSNCFIPATNYLIAPAHNFLTDTGEWSQITELTVQATLESRGPVFRVKVSPAQMYRLPGDAMLVQINSGGTMPYVLDLIAEEPPKVPVPALEISRDPATCAIKRMRYIARPERIVCRSHNMTYWGCAYDRPEPTYKGLCGAVLLAAARFPQVFAFHTMGRDGRGVACCLRRTDIVEGIEVLRSTGLIKAPVVTQPTTQPFTHAGTEELGVVGPLCERSVLREVKPGTEFKPLGTLLNYKQVRPKSRLEVSPLSPLVEELCGEPRKHGPPASIGKATVEVAKLHEMAGRVGINPVDMQLAVQDTYEEMCALVESLDYGRYLRPLTMDEATSGIAGSSSVRAINRGTAAGWPFVGNKHPFVVDNPREGLPDAFSLTPEVQAEVERALDVMGRLERVNFVFKGSHKDEGKKLGSLKTRLFEGSPLVLTIITRMLFMPIVRLYLLARLETGSAVGIDATSLEWDELFGFLTAYNPKEAIVGDWIHFDTSQAYQEMMCVFTIFIGVSTRYGTFTEVQENQMWSTAEETSRHYALFRGDLGITEGTNGSGGVLTVYTNNPVGENRFKASWYGMARDRNDIPEVPLWDLSAGGVTSGGLPILRNGRAGFKPLLPNVHGRFADYVRGTYYGDDFVQTARDCILHWYNQLTLEAYFAREGLFLTDASKKPFTAPTTPWAEVTFLKRGFRHDEDAGCVMAPLDLDSVFKSLHIWPQKLAWSREVHAAQLISGALRELVQHGRAVYDVRAPALIKVAERFGCREYMLEKDVSFDGMLTSWYKKGLLKGLSEIVVPDESE